MLPKFLSGTFVCHQSALANSISTGEFGGITINSFQRCAIDPKATTNKFVQLPFTKPWNLEESVGHLVNVLNKFCYNDVNPDYSVWTHSFYRYRDQLKSKAARTAAMEPGTKVVTILVHHLNIALVDFAAALINPAYYEYTDQEWIDFTRKLLRYDDLQIIGEANGSNQDIPAQFSNFVSWKVSPVADPQVVNPIIAADIKNRTKTDKRKKEEPPHPIKDKKVKVDKKDQLCIAHFQFQEGLKAKPCNNQKNNGKCERKHTAAPANGVKWSKDVFDKLADGVNSFVASVTKDAILAHIATLR